MLKRHLFILSTTTVLSLILAACSGLGPGAAGQDATEPPATSAATDVPTVIPIDLAGPEMKVGSFYSYVDGSILAAVPGGPFKMGFNNYFDAKEHEVTVSDFWIYTNEVTNKQYAWCVSLGKCTAPDPTDDPEFQNYRFGSSPIVGVVYEQAADYCAFVNGRLPTEAEWEKAARGPESNIFPWGENAPACDLLNFDFCNGTPVDVKSYPDGVSYYGVFDMSGNVKEWAADFYKPDYDLDQVTDPIGAVTGQKRSVRSSSYSDSADFAFAAHRFSLNPINHLPDVGFRCVVGDPTFYAPYCQTSLLFGSDGHGNPTDQVVQTSDNCIQPGFDVNADCEQQETRIEVIPANLPSDYAIQVNDPGGVCTDDGPQKYTCDGHGQDTGSIVVKPGECKVLEDPSQGECPPPSVPGPSQDNSDETVCIGQGLGVNCAEGYQYNEIMQCCSAVNTDNSPGVDCPPGFEKVGNVCVNDQSSDPPQLVSVDFGPVGVCPPHGGGGDDEVNSCPNVCLPYEKQCGDCRCIYNTFSC